MEWLLLSVLFVLGAAQRVPSGYHANEGIPTAERIRAAEEAGYNTNFRSTGEAYATLGTHPYLAGLLITLQTGDLSVCGASLISSTRLLTAAKCWWDGSHYGVSLEAVLGSTTLYYGGTRVNSSDVVLHEGYNTFTQQNDIAVVKIPWVWSTTTIRPIALPSGYQLAYDFNGYMGKVAGYGRSAFDLITRQSQRQSTVKVVPNSSCSQWYTPHVFLSTICTSGVGGVGVCPGDQGGPLVVSVYGIPTVVGVASYHYVSGCKAGLPSAYTRVTSHAAWIRSKL